jgi:hypothetical protein
LPPTQVTVIRILEFACLKTIVAASTGPALTRSTSYGSVGCHDVSCALPPTHRASTDPADEVRVLVPVAGADEAGADVAGGSAAGADGPPEVIDPGGSCAPEAVAVGGRVPGPTALPPTAGPPCW